MKKYFIFLALFLGIVLISVGIKFEGGLAKIIMIIGIISVIKGVFLIKGKAAEKMLVLGERMPLMYFRIGGLAYIAIGVIILLLR